MSTETDRPSLSPEEAKMISDAIHFLSSAMQTFHSYEQLLENGNFHIQPKKMQEICRKSAIRCREVRQIILERIK